MSKIKAVFIGFQEDKDGNHIPLFNVGKYTHTATTLARRGIDIPEIPQDTELAGQCLRVQREGRG